MVLVARTAPDTAPPPPPPDTRPGRLQLIRGATVVVGGPLLLAAASLVAPVAAVRRWPDRLPAGRRREAAWSLTRAGVVAPWVYAALVRPWLRNWGSTEAERWRRYPGDPENTERRPFATNTRAVTVNAPAEEVWRWLVQIGQDRGGFYSYDWLENLAGCHLHSAEEIRPELQHLEVGDPLVIFPGIATEFRVVDPPRALVIEGWGALLVEPVDDHSCRLVARSHIPGGPAALAALLTMELPHAVMERKMLLGIKRRAERARRLDRPGAGS